MLYFDALPIFGCVDMMNGSILLYYIAARQVLHENVNRNELA